MQLASCLYIHILIHVHSPITPQLFTHTLSLVSAHYHFHSILLMANYLFVALAALIVVVLVSAPMSKAITCGQAATSIAPCLGYAKSGSGNPPTSCCNGVKSLNALAKTTPDRQAVCSCLKKAASSVTGLNAAAAASIPAKCGVNLPYVISTSIDCAKVH